MSIQETEIRPPHPALAFTELCRATAELSFLPFAAGILARAPRGDGHPVLVLPGFTAGDRATALLRRYLKSLGYQVHGWELGVNLDHRSTGADGRKIHERVQALQDRAGRRVSLIGWSLGGIQAREIARRDPTHVRQVISLGSPFTGNPRASNLRRTFEWVTGQALDSPQFRRRMAQSAGPLDVPSVAIFSKTDGVVAWRNCVDSESRMTDNIEVHGSHCGLVVNPAVLYAIADRLAQPEGEWAPFDRGGWRAAFYPAPDTVH